MSQPAFDFGESGLDDDAGPTFGVAELADAINAQLRRGFSDGVWVRGEIDGLSNRGPHHRTKAWRILHQYFRPGHEAGDSSAQQTANSVALFGHLTLLISFVVPQNSWRSA